MRLGVLPIIFSSPDTGYAFGVLPQLFFFPGQGRRSSSLRLDAYYTQKRQYNLRLSSGLWLAGDAISVTGKFGFRSWPTTFYGIGNNGNAEPEDFAERAVTFNAKAQRRLRDNLFAGILYAVRVSNFSRLALDGELEKGEIPGSEDGVASGVGAAITWDSRDHLYYPTAGALHTLQATLFARGTGSDYGFSLYSLDTRWYVSPGPGHVIAIQSIVEVCGGSPPFRMLPKVGDQIRGYSSVRYTDCNLLAAQVEYRIVPIWWRIGIAVFAGAGQVAPSARQFAPDRFHAAIGVGVRFQIYRREQVHVRQDFAFGEGSLKDYLDLNEAF